MLRSGPYFLDPESLLPGEAIVRHEDSEHGPGWRCFRAPVSVICAQEPEEVLPAVQAASRHAESGGWAVGFLSYEAAPGLNTSLITKTSEWPVLAWFALYADPPSLYRELVPVYEPVDLEGLASEWSLKEYRVAFGRVKEALRKGESYQVNLTFRQRFGLGALAGRLFSSRCGIDPPPYAAFIQGGEWQIASFSPELLYQRVGRDIVTRPMKGTALIPDEAEREREVARELSEDPKSIAENIMIVDMVRNDLGRVAETGTVRTPMLLHVEKHRGLFQMTSTVTAESGRSTEDLLRALFPAASITGAPKVATARLIAELESSPRHLYCGSIGILGPGCERFSVAIRTALVRNGRGEFGVGSGLVWDSSPEAEYQECLDKRELLLREGRTWELVEALGAHHLGDLERVERHLSRLSASASELGIPLDIEAIRRELRDLTPQPSEGRPVKVRVAVRADGTYRISTEASMLPDRSLSAALAMSPVASGDPNFRLKTNSRAVLNEHLRRHPEADEVLLYNERGEVTEFCRGNVLARIGDTWLTPDPACGCLAGETVADLVRRGEASYSRILISDLDRVAELRLANSVIGLAPVRLIIPEPRPDLQKVAL